MPNRSPPAFDECAQVSRDPPPPLPGGYKLGEKVFYTGLNHSFPSGNKLVHGQQGEVVGPANLETHKGKGVALPRQQGQPQLLPHLGTPPLRRPRYHPARLCTPRDAVCVHTRSRPSLDPPPAASHCGGGSAGEGPWAYRTPLPLMNARR